MQWDDTDLGHFKWITGDMDIEKIFNEHNELQDYQAYFASVVNVIDMEAIFHDSDDYSSCDSRSCLSTRTKRKRSPTEDLIMRNYPASRLSLEDCRDVSEYSSILCELLNRGQKKQLYHFIETSFSPDCKITASKPSGVKDETSLYMIADGKAHILAFVNRLIDSVPDGVYMNTQVTHQPSVNGSTIVSYVTMNGTQIHSIFQQVAHAWNNGQSTATSLIQSARNLVKNVELSHNTSVIDIKGTLVISVDKNGLITGLYLHWPNLEPSSPTTVVA